MGTAGFIVYMRKRLQELGINIEPENIHGIEVEPDTYKYAFLNMLLTTGRNCENLNLADSLAENTMAQKADFIYRFRQEGTEKVSNKFKGLKKDVNGLSSSVKRLAVVFGAGFLGKQMFDAGRGAIDTAAQFETLKVRLGNMYGSVQRGTPVSYTHLTLPTNREV